MKLSIIAAIARDNAIGRQGDLLFHIREDLRHFKRVTLGHPVIMGRKTFESLPGGPLPGRENIVVSRTPGYAPPGVKVSRSLDDAINSLPEDSEPFIIGGGQIYAEALPKADTLWLTEIDAAVTDADTFFPAIDPESWKTESLSDPQTDPATQINYRFICMTRR